MNSLTEAEFDAAIQQSRYHLKPMGEEGGPEWLRAVEKVEVSLDGGQNWQEAMSVGPDLGQYAWRIFAMPTELAPGQYAAGGEGGQWRAITTMAGADQLSKLLS